ADEGSRGTQGAGRLPGLASFRRQRAGREPRPVSADPRRRLDGGQPRRHVVPQREVVRGSERAHRQDSALDTRPTMTDYRTAPLQFQLRKLGHVVLNVTDLEASVRFYTEVLGLEISDRYPDSMVPGGMVFMRCNSDPHGVALVGGTGKSERTSLNHFAFEVATLDEVFRTRAW